MMRSHDLSTIEDENVVQHPPLSPLHRSVSSPGVDPLIKSPDLLVHDTTTPIIKRPFTSQSHEWGHLPDLAWFFAENVPMAARPLIAWLLHPDPAQRPTATEAMRDEWCAVQDTDEQDSPRPSFNSTSGHESKDVSKNECAEPTKGGVRSATDKLVEGELGFINTHENEDNCVDGEADDFYDRLRSHTISFDGFSTYADENYEQEEQCSAEQRT